MHAAVAVRTTVATLLAATVLACAPSQPLETAPQAEPAPATPAPTPTPEALDRACRAGDFQACADFGWLLFGEATDAGDALHVLELFERACDGGAGDGCSGLGVVYFEGFGVTEDFRQAFEHWQRSCELDSGSGCAYLGVAYLFGLGARTNPLRAAEVWGRACDLGEPDACRFAGDVYVQEGPLRDVATALDFWERGCELGDPESCVAVARQLYTGTLVRADHAAALDFFARACTHAGAAGCVTAGNLHRYEADDAGDFDVAADYYRRACELQEPRGCQLLVDVQAHQACLAEGRADCEDWSAPLTPLECTGESGFGVVTVTPEQYSGRAGVGVTELPDLETSLERPAEVCLLEGELDFLMGLHCADGSSPFDERRSAHGARAGNVGAGGRCGRTIDLYVVPCPEGDYRVFLDMYVCPPATPQESS